MVTLGQAAAPLSDEMDPRSPAARISMLRMGLAGRLALAGAAMVLLWSAIALGLA